jgi:hypothetical protein
MVKRTTPASPLAFINVRALLARIDRRLVDLRLMLGHDHRDVAFWGTRSPARAQMERRKLRAIASILHVWNATRRGHLLARSFSTLTDQRAYCAHVNDYMWLLMTEMMDTPSLVELRVPKLPEP